MMHIWLLQATRAKHKSGGKVSMAMRCHYDSHGGCHYDSHETARAIYGPRRSLAIETPSGMHEGLRSLYWTERSVQFRNTFLLVGAVTSRVMPAALKSSFTFAYFLL